MTLDSEILPEGTAGMEPVRVLRGPDSHIWALAWSPTGRVVTAGSSGPIYLWDLEADDGYSTLDGHEGLVLDLSWSPDGALLASAGADATVRLWDAVERRQIRRLDAGGGAQTSVAWSPDGTRIAVTHMSTEAVRIWGSADGEEHDPLVMPAAYRGKTIAWSPDGGTLGVGTEQGPIVLFHLADGSRTELVGHNATVCGLSWAPDGSQLTSGADDRTVRVWSVKSGTAPVVLEGHTNVVKGVAFSVDGRLIASKSYDQSVRVWRADTGHLLVKLDEPTAGLRGGVAFHPTAPMLAFVGSDSDGAEADRLVRLWRFDDATLMPDVEPGSVRYATAKLVLVGESGVGKTGLAWRLAHGSFKEHPSTHGQQFWVVDDLATTRPDGTECEAVLWDLAGQPDYRLIHSLFLGDVDLALVLFDPTNRYDPLGGVDFWLGQLGARGKELTSVVLVGARVDRGTSTLTTEELEGYCRRRGIGGGYLATSAKRGDGVGELVSRIRELTPWDRIEATVTTATFKRMKDFVLSLKERAAGSDVLVGAPRLREHLESVEVGWEFSESEMATVVRHLERHGYVSVLRSSDGREFVLLTPDLLSNLASSFVLEARRNPRGLGVLEEERVMRGDYRFPELGGLAGDDAEILLDAVTSLFVQNNLCFRETFNDRVFLVFPSLINEKQPAQDLTDWLEDATYRVTGAVENVYASLVVLLGYTNTFIRTNQWQNQAQYELGEGDACGFRQVANNTGDIELVLQYGQETPDHVRMLFRGLFERFLLLRDVRVERYEPVGCTACGARLDRAVVRNRLDEGHDYSFCSGCGERLVLPTKELLTAPAQEVAEEVATQQAIAESRTAFETAVGKIKSLVRSRGGAERKPSCFISYAWGVPEHERWTLRLAKDLRNADIDVVLDRWQNPPGASLSRFVDLILATDFVVVVGTPALRVKYETNAADPVVAAELRLLNTRLRKPVRFGSTVIPLLVAGEADESLTPQLQDLVAVPFHQEGRYFVHLLNLLWRLYDLPFDKPLLEELEDSIAPPVQ